MWGGECRVNVWYGEAFSKFRASRMFPFGIFWRSCCCSCDRGKTKSTPTLIGLEFDKGASFVIL